MKMVVQRVSRADIAINGRPPQSMGAGLVVLVGIAATDTREIIDYLVEKLLNLRIFNDSDGKFNHSLMEVSGDLLLVSNFTLYANAKKGRRPSFVQAAPPEIAIPLYEELVDKLKDSGVPLLTGEFGADMQVGLVNDGPVTLILDSDELCANKGDVS